MSIRPAFLLCNLMLALAAEHALAQSTLEQVPTDWDLYMLRLVNRARTDPVGEDLLHGTNYAETPVPPLAYAPLIGRAAQNHNEWMSVNRDNPSIGSPDNTGPAPSSFSHFETLNGQPGDATGRDVTSGWSGDDLGQRVSFTGYSWGTAGENIAWRSNTPTIGAPLIEDNHLGWWNSAGHRRNMMSDGFTVFGHHVLNDTEGATQNQWATQNFARLLFSPHTYLFGLVYTDRDASGDWTPRDENDPLREGLGGIPYEVVSAGGGRTVATGSTFENGAYSVNIGDGSYDVIFTDAALAEGSLTISNTTVTGFNVDLGDTLVELATDGTLLAGDANQDLQFDQLDLVSVLGANKYLTGQGATWSEGDWNGAPGGSPGNPPAGDGLFDQRDIIAALAAAVYLTGPYHAGRPADDPLLNAGEAIVPTGQSNVYAATFAGELDSIRFLGEAPAGAFVQRTGVYEAEIQGPQAGGSMTAVDAVVAVPEPSGAALFGLAVFSLALVLLTQSENTTRRALSS